MRSTRCAQTITGELAAREEPLAMQGHALICTGAQNGKVAEEGLEQGEFSLVNQAVREERAAESGAVVALASDADYLRARWPWITDQAVRRITSLIEAELRERD